MSLYFDMADSTVDNEVGGVVLLQFANKANMRNLIAVTGLVVLLIWIQIIDFSSSMT